MRLKGRDRLTESSEVVETGKAGGGKCLYRRGETRNAEVGGINSMMPNDTGPLWGIRCNGRGYRCVSALEGKAQDARVC